MRARKEERNQAIWEAVRAGRMQKDIAQDFGLSRGRVCKIYHEYDSRMREGGENETDHL